MSLAIVGTVAFDSVKTPHGQVDKVIGGAATFAGWAASYLHQEIRLISIIGEDWPVSELNKMKDRGMDLSGIEIVPGGKSFYWSGEYDDNMIDRTTLTTELNVLDDFDPNLPEKYRDSEFLMLGNLTPKIQQQVISQMNRKPRMIVMDTMNFWIDIARESLIETIRQVDVLSINDEEARLLSGEYNLLRAANKILQYGLQFLIIKKGEHGALLFGDGQMYYTPALPLAEITDPTGAGDSFAGGMMGYLASQENIDFETMKMALIHGSAMGSFCVEDYSIVKLQNLTPEMIKNRVEDLIQLSKINHPPL